MITKSMYDDALDYAISGSLFPDSILHGEDHWRGVAAQGLWLANHRSLGLKGRTVALLFGLFHDCRRENDGWDPEHGTRGATALLDCPALETLPPSIKNTLMESMIHHDGGLTTEDPLIGLGWDSDRSLLGRVGIIPNFSFFSIIDGENFPTFLEHGESYIQTAPEWDDLWYMAQ